MLVMGVFNTFLQIFALITAIGLGLAITSFIYTYIVLASARKDVELQGVVIPDEVNELVRKYQEKYAFESRRKDKSKFTYAIDISKEVVEDIAKINYNDSNFPLYEISIEEALELNRYLTRRIDLLFNRRGLNAFKSIRVSQVLYVMDLKNNVTELPIYQRISKTYNTFGPFVKKVLYVLGLLNPFKWVKKIVTKLGIGISTNMICKEIIHICAEESYKIYSKSLFTAKVSIEEAEEVLEYEETI